MGEIFDFIDAGNVEFTSFAVIDGEKISGKNVLVADNAISGGCEGVYKDDFYFSPAENGIACRRVFQNISGKTIKLNEIGFTLEKIDFALDPHDDFFYHNENPRIYAVMTFPVDYKRTAEDAKDSAFDIQAGNKWADPGVIQERIGCSPYQPFPAILLGNYKSKYGIVHGTLSQKIFYHNYLIKHDENKNVTMDVFSSFKATDHLEIPAGKVLVDQWYLGTTDRADDLEEIFASYTVELRKVLPANFGATKINRDCMVWGSWNDGIFRNVSEELVLKEARYLKENFPTVKWIQLDDGYAVHATEYAHGLGMPYEGEAGVDHKKFPCGLRRYSDELRKLGLRPAVWIGGFCPRTSPIYKDHPEWFSDYSYRVDFSSPLDVSIPEVREYMTSALDKFFGDYGFEGMKHDFWSYLFEDSHNLMKNHDVSGYEYRRWWLQEIRKRLAPDGYLQTGCDIVMGNPFLGEYFTNYRYGIDIGNGTWEYLKITYLWGAACFAIHTGDLFVPNGDSIGLFEGLNDTEAMFCMNYCLVMHAMVEIAGKLSEHQNSPRMKALKKTACNPNNGQDIYFINYNYLDHKNVYPEMVYFKTPHFSVKENGDCIPLRTVGIFNVEEEARRFEFSVADLKLPEGRYTLTDVRSGEVFEFDENGKFNFELIAHGSRLLAVSRKEGLQLLDADIRIVESRADADSVRLTSDYGANAELKLNFAPSAIKINGKAVDFVSTAGNVIQLYIPEKSEIVIEK